MKTKKKTLSEATKKKISASLKEYNKNKKQTQKKEQKPTKKQAMRKRKETNHFKKLQLQLGFLPPSLPKRTIQKIKSGRPTKYRKEMCEQLILLMGQGKSKASALVEMGITEGTAWSWCNEYTEYTGKDNKMYKKLNTNFKSDFLKAIKIGEQLNQWWWEEISRLNMHNKDFNCTLWMMNMQNRFGWSRRIDGKIEINETHREIREVIFKFEADEIKSYIRELAKLGVIEIPAQIH